MTCVLREMNCLNAENEIDVRAMKKDAEQYNMPSVWFKNRYEEILDTCHEVVTGYWGYHAVCGGAICEMEPGLALSLTPQPYRTWWAASCQVAQCKFNPRRLHEAE